LSFTQETRRILRKLPRYYLKLSAIYWQISEKR
jgi:hypothetical protein